ncbi:MAG: high-affinity branched-chain amino acid ABC transporter permease LivM [Desulfofustis sp. PB-SRB1]|jgi:branched-chain amino acid transport system permease protein|nr:high-affinity branched-chain amino acid ABC transporter permease LivM [Desulfofustis sp. PB-SRB1]MBM1001466.1 high-affinity branched-chain amino acid ABC transporter permease LivM [Desulfofustis sp. PB-SRB1]HBH28154.1 branched-chain amino acid ABC transporter permease [Desulfofustis sp.]
MIRELRKIWKSCFIGLLWFLALLWPMTGINSDGTLTFARPLEIWLIVVVAAVVIMLIYSANKSGMLAPFTRPVQTAAGGLAGQAARLPIWVWLLVALGLAMFYPVIFTSRPAHDVAINVLIYISLGLGLNIVIGLAGMLDLGYIAFYGVGAYTYALLNVYLGFSFWTALPFAALFAAIAGCIIGYPTLRMRGDYLAIVTLAFGEIVRLILNNWMELTNGPNGVLGIDRPTMLVPTFDDGFGFEVISLRKLYMLYYVALALAVFTMLCVYRLNYSRIGRAWEAIREDETAAELMGVNTFLLKLLAYAMGAVFAGLAGAFFAGRMKFVSPESFTFLESAMVLCMVVLGGMASIPGIILGAAALVLMQEWFREFETYRMLVFGGCMVLMMLFRPAGLIPARRMGRRSEDDE